MAVKDDIIVTLYTLKLRMVDATDNNALYKVEITLNNSNQYEMYEYNRNNELISTFKIDENGEVIEGNKEQFQNNKIMVRAYNILFNYYLITNQVRNREVILENTSDKFIIRTIESVQADNTNPYHIHLAPHIDIP